MPRSIAEILEEKIQDKEYRTGRSRTEWHPKYGDAEPGIRGVDERALSGAEKMVRSFERMPQHIQKKWLEDPHNRGRLEDAYMRLEETAVEPPPGPDPDRGITTPPEIPQGPPGGIPFPIPNPEELAEGPPQGYGDPESPRVGTGHLCT